MPFTDVLQRFGDAISGTDREAAYRKGELERATVNEHQAQTDAAMALARDRRADAQKKEREQAARDALREQQVDLNNPDTLPGMQIMEAGFGNEYAGLQQGRTRAQEYNQSKTIATPSEQPTGFGDELEQDPAAEAGRVAAMEARAPAAALASRRPRPAAGEPNDVYIDESGQTVIGSRTEARGHAPGSRPPAAGEPNEIVIGDDGKPVITTRSDARGRAPGARPSAGTGRNGTPASGIKTADSALIGRKVNDIFKGTFDPVSGRIMGLDPTTTQRANRIAARAAKIFIQGGVDHATAVDQALQEVTSGGTPPQIVTGGEVQERGFGDEAGTRSADDHPPAAPLPSVEIKREGPKFIAGGAVDEKGFGDETATQPAVPRGAGAPSAKAAAAKDPLEGRTATGPGGKKVKRVNGEWVPIQ